jgi:hypothetical protein
MTGLSMRTLSQNGICPCVATCIDDVLKAFGT